jgi:hypothetical protein
MKTFHKTVARITITLSALVLIFSGMTIAPHAVHAQVGAQAVYVINPDIAAGATGATAVSTGYLAQVKPKLDGIQWLIAKVAIQAITKSMVNWINSGFNGSPAFVTNLDQNLLSVSDGVANSFFSALSNNTGNGVVSPFQNLVTQQLRNSYYSTGRSSGGGYDLNKFSNNPAGFLAGNFVANGGFNAWFAAVGNNSNNPYGAAYDAQNQLNAAVYQATTNRLNELNWGKGFMSWRGPCTSKAPAAAATSLSTADNCTQYSIKTPGSIVEDSLGITVNSPFQIRLIRSSVRLQASSLTRSSAGQGFPASRSHLPAAVPLSLIKLRIHHNTLQRMEAIRAVSYNLSRMTL